MTGATTLSLWVRYAGRWTWRDVAAADILGTEIRRSTQPEHDEVYLCMSDGESICVADGLDRRAAARRAAEWRDRLATAQAGIV